MADEPKVEISKITLPKIENNVSGTKTYHFKDSGARDLIQQLTDIHRTAVHYAGVVDETLKDGATTNPIRISGELKYAQNGDIVITTGSEDAAPREFIFKRNNPNNPDDMSGVWNEFGSSGSLKNLAFKNSVSASYTPQGSVLISENSFNGNRAKIESDYTPSGTISQPIFTGTPATITVTGTIEASTATTSYLPSGTVSTPIFTGTEAILEVSGKRTGTPTYIPEGTVSEITASPSIVVSSIKGIYEEGQSSKFSMEVNDQVLEFFFEPDVQPTYTTKNFVTDVSVTLSQPTFTGTETRLTTTYTPAGTLSEPIFSGNGVTLESTIDNLVHTMQGQYTPAGIISTPAFSGTQGVATGYTTPSGSVTGLSFSGSNTTIVSS